MNRRKAEALIMREVNRMRDEKHRLEYDRNRKRDADRCTAEMKRRGRLGHFAKNSYPDIAYVQYGAGRMSESTLARKAVYGWHSSPGHNQYLHHDRFRKCGVSVRMSGNRAYIALVLSKGFWGI